MPAPEQLPLPQPPSRPYDLRPHLEAAIRLWRERSEYAAKAPGMPLEARMRFEGAADAYDKVLTFLQSDPPTE